MNKIGLSTIVSLVIIMVVSMSLAVATGTLLLTFTKASLSPTLSCTELQIASPISVDACYNLQTQEIVLNTRRSFNSQGINSLDFLIPAQGKKWTCSSQCGNCELLLSGDSKTYYLSLEDYIPNSTLAIMAGGCTLATVKIPICAQSANA